MCLRCAVISRASRRATASCAACSMPLGVLRLASRRTEERNQSNAATSAAWSSAAAAYSAACRALCPAFLFACRAIAQATAFTIRATAVTLETEAVMQLDLEVLHRNRHEDTFQAAGDPKDAAWLKKELRGWL